METAIANDPANPFLAANLEAIETDLGDMESVAVHSARAATEASKAGDDATLYAALVQQAYARIDSGQPADALGICDAAEALAARGVPLPEKIVIARAGALLRLGKNWNEQRVEMLLVYLRNAAVFL